MVTLVFDEKEKTATIHKGITKGEDCILEKFSDVTQVRNGDRRYEILTTEEGGSRKVAAALPLKKTIYIQK